MTPTSIDTVIVGAGPYGLSIAAHLRAAGIPFQILGTPLESWRSFMPEGMYLKSEPFASNLSDPQRNFTLERFSAEKRLRYQAAHDPLSIERFVNYCEWFRDRAVGDVRDVKVCRIRSNSSFTLNLADGTSLEARNVILATGHMAFRFVPPELSHLPEPLCMHSTMIGDVKAYAGRDVTIIGAGQSALESAALLRENGANVRVLVRAGRVEWNKGKDPRSFADWMRAPQAGLGAGWVSLAVSELPRVFRTLFPADKRHRYVRSSWGPSGAWWLRERIEGKIDLLLRHQLRSAHCEGAGVRLVVEGPEGVQEVLTDHVIAATGYRMDLDRLDYLDGTLRQKIAREAYAPLLTAQFETSIPGLFVVGIASAPTFGPVMRFVFGAKHAAPIIARRLKS